MTTRDATAAFAAFREVVFDDFHLLMRLRPPREQEAYVAHVVALGTERGLTFDESAVRAALRAGEQTWLTQDGDAA